MTLNVNETGNWKRLSEIVIKLTQIHLFIRSLLYIKGIFGSEVKCIIMKS
ncbi:hypothetical protein J2Z18_003556 [Paenibacillus lactis]|uniref:Uncharacterized protein n=1 Tax=Paenibacillus lactis TaxID=228574 RepID=A0ABS4FDX8_9BACL|nr:hypothetical protein [Paenibacillus lactis]